MTTEEKEIGELITIPETNIRSLFDGTGMDNILKNIEEQARSFVLDVSTPKGRKEIASIANKIARSKVAIDNAGKDLVSGMKEEAKKIDAERKKARDFLDGLKAEIREPLTEFEEAEKKRVGELEARIQSIRDAIVDLPTDSESIGKIRGRLKTTEPETFSEFSEQAAGALALALMKVDAAYEEAVKREKEAAELEQLRKEKAEAERKEREEAIRKEAAERARKEAGEKASREKAEAEAAHQREIERQRKEAEERELKAKLEADERERKIREEVEAEKRRIEEEKAEVARKAKLEADEQAEREADKKHRASVKKSAVDALVKTGIDGSQAEIVFTAISNGDIPRVSLSY